MQLKNSFVGLDIHKKHIYGVVMDTSGNTLFERKFRTEPHEIDQFLKRLDKESAYFALESCSCWEFVYDYLTDAGFVNVKLANPSRVGLIATSKKKTDRHDAKVLADLLRSNMLPLSYAPPGFIRENRQLTRHRADMGKLQGNIKNKIHAILIRHGISSPCDNVFTKEGINFLCSLELPNFDRYQMDNYLQLVRHCDVIKGKVEKRIEEQVEHQPEVKLLMTIPGISYYSGLSIASEIGEMRRFTNAKKLVSYAGLNTSVSQSADRCYMGRIAKQGNRHLRWMLGQCANVAVMNDSILAKYYQRLKKHKGHNKAITATARKMLCYIYSMITNNISYQQLQIHKKKAS